MNTFVKSIKYLKFLGWIKNYAQSRTDKQMPSLLTVNLEPVHNRPVNPIQWLVYSQTNNRKSLCKTIKALNL